MRRSRRTSMKRTGNARRRNSRPVSRRRSTTSRARRSPVANRVQRGRGARRGRAASRRYTNSGRRSAMRHTPSHMNGNRGGVYGGAGGPSNLKTDPRIQQAQSNSRLQNWPHGPDQGVQWTTLKTSPAAYSGPQNVFNDLRYHNVKNSKVPEGQGILIRQSVGRARRRR